MFDILLSWQVTAFVACSVLIWLLFAERDKANTTGAALASRLGLTFTPARFFGQASLAGTYREVEIDVNEVVRGGKHKQRWVVFKVRVPNQAAPPGLVLFREGLLAKAGKLFGTEDVQIGDPLVDEAFILRGVSVQIGRDFFSRPGVKDALLSLKEICPAMKLERNELFIEFRGSISEMSLLQAHIESIVECARTIAGLNSEPSIDNPAAGSSLRGHDQAQAPGPRLSDAQDPWAMPTRPSDKSTDGQW
ncbi:MAG: hypothetical protein H0U74_04620 [Bradymonadaceae bacterium]|nr:hypothetical protein [Lujinxingiaceae bacterium]